MHAAAEEQSNPLRQARALRLMAERYEKSGVATRIRQEALPRTEEAYELLAGLPSSTNVDIELERALICESAGRMREKVKQLPSAGRDYRLAIDHYRKVPGDFAKQKVTELKAKLESLGCSEPASPQPQPRGGVTQGERCRGGD